MAGRLCCSRGHVRIHAGFFCAQHDNSRVLCCNWHTSSTKQTLSYTSLGIQICGKPMHTWAHTHGRCAARPPSPEAGLGTMTQLTQLDIMSEPDEDGHEEYSLTTLE
eukprot:351580-Chlamydomonas_euryale.AAC.4